MTIIICHTRICIENEKLVGLVGDSPIDTTLSSSPRYRYTIKNKNKTTNAASVDALDFLL